MPNTYSMTASVLAPTSGFEGAFLQAREILRQTDPLTFDQFVRLDELFRQVSGREFATLIDDPKHQIQLRRYEVLSWRNSSPLILVAVMIASIVAATAVWVFQR